jgi:hypothetical protein
MTQPLSPAPRPSIADDLRDAIAPRTVLLVTGVLLLQLGFILSYVGAFHTPGTAPHPRGHHRPRPGRAAGRGRA